MSGFVAWRGLSLLVVLLLFVTVVGCGEPTGNVSGEVKIKDKAVPLGTIVFHPQGRKAKAVLADIIDGKYTARGISAGEVIVTVQATTPKPPSNIEKKAMKTANVAPTFKIPVKYVDPKTSGLTFTVKSGENTYDPPLEEEAPPPKK